MDGGTRAMELPEQDLGDRILVVQAPDKRKSKREVPDASMWGSCFTLFERALLLADPARGPEMSAYRETIQKAARTHQWDFVLHYDRQFRQAAAGDRSRSWAKLDSALFMQELAQHTWQESGPLLGDLTVRPEKEGERWGQEETREALRGRNYRVSVISLTSRMECASLVRDAGSGMHARSVVVATPGPGVTAHSYSGGEGTPGEDQELARAKPCRESQWY